MPEKPRTVKKPKVLIKNLGAGKEIGAADMKSIRGGEYRCPSKTCRTLVVKIIAGARATKHTIIIDKTV